MITRLAVLAAAIVLGASAAHAQPSAVFGKPLPDATLANGTIVVRVIDGSPMSPLAKVTVTLVVNGVARTAMTDDRGRASFDSIAAGAQVRASTTVGGKRLDSEPFAAPQSGGVRVLLSTASTPPTPGLPPPRDRSGEPRSSAEDAAGTLLARVVYNDLADPAVGLPVTLVGYAADERVTIATQKTNRAGTAKFTGLDQTGATAYFAMTLLPRAGDVDRLVSRPVMLDASSGVRVLLSGDQRRSTAAPLDDLPGTGAANPANPATPVAKGKLHVALVGVPDATSTVTLIDAASGKPAASATVTAPDTHAVFDVAARAGQVLYAESTMRGQRLRSHPFLPIARGTAIELHALPRVLVRFAIRAEAAEPVLVVRGSFEVQNNAWIPYRAGELPLPRGFQDAILADSDAELADLTAAGVRLRAPLPPGGRRLRVGFTLPAVKDKVRWDLDLPHGVFDGSVQIAREAGMTVDVPAGVALVARDDAFVLEKIMIQPKLSMTMTIGMPKLSAAEKALARACRGMSPDRSSPLRGQPMPALVAPQLDGTPLRLASLRGKLVVVHFTGSWVGLSRTELPTFAAAAAAIPDLVVVLVASDTKADDVRAMIGAKSPFRAVLDPPPDPATDHIGPITKSWKVPLLPESFVIDRGGTVRLYLPNTRDWSSAEALSCLKALK